MIQEQSKMPSKADNEAMWEQRRYEIAKEVLAGFAASQEGIAEDRDIVYAIHLADILIKRLKHSNRAEIGSVKNNQKN